MTIAQYEKKIKSICRQVEVLSFNDDSDLGLKFDIFSASLKNYLPSIPYSSHKSIFREVIKNQKLSIFEQSYFDLIEKCEIIGYKKEIETIISNSPCIICTYHTGSYRLINHFLVKNKTNFTLVIANKVKNKYGSVFSNLFETMTLDAKSGTFDLLDAEDPASGLKMYKALKAGRSLLLYIDGNTGSSDKNKNICDINFLSQRIYARKGIGYLSYLANVPIIPVICKRGDQNRIILFFEDIMYPDRNQTKDEYSLGTTIKLYQYLEKFLKLYPGQWEGWSYLHKTAHIINTFKTENSDAFNLNNLFLRSINFKNGEYSLFRDSRQCFLFQKQGYRFFPISEDVFRELKKMKLESESLF